MLGNFCVCVHPLFLSIELFDRTLPRPQMGFALTSLVRRDTDLES